MPIRIVRLQTRNPLVAALLAVLVLAVLAAVVVFGAALLAGVAVVGGAAVAVRRLAGGRALRRGAVPPDQTLGDAPLDPRREVFAAGPDDTRRLPPP
jgi:O-antigen ligase